MDRRAFLQDAAAGAVALALPGRTPITHADDLSPVFAQIEKRHDEAVQRLQEWIRQPSIAAERRRSEEHTSELQSQSNLVCRLLLAKKKDHRSLPPSPRRLNQR